MRNCMQVRYAVRMSLHKPLDLWRMVAGRRIVEGCVPLSALPRLAGLLFERESEGEVAFSLGFDRDALGIAYAELALETILPLQCQRSLQRFGFPVKLHQRLGLIRKEEDEAGLPPGYEPLLVPENGEVRALDLIEDELILVIPVVPVDPDSTQVAPPLTGIEPEERPHPFAALAALKQKS